MTHPFPQDQHTQPCTPPESQTCYDCLHSHHTRTVCSLRTPCRRTISLWSWCMGHDPSPSHTLLLTRKGICLIRVYSQEDLKQVCDRWSSCCVCWWGESSWSGQLESTHQMSHLIVKGMKMNVKGIMMMMMSIFTLTSRDNRRLLLASVKELSSSGCDAIRTAAELWWLAATAFLLGTLGGCATILTTSILLILTSTSWYARKEQILN